jgi:hypothetical protein
MKETAVGLRQELAELIRLQVGETQLGHEAAFASLTGDKARERWTKRSKSSTSTAWVWRRRSCILRMKSSSSVADGDHVSIRTGTRRGLAPSGNNLRRRIIRPAPNRQQPTQRRILNEMRWFPFFGVMVLLVACGGGPSLATQVEQLTSGHSVICDKAGFMVFVGERETVYGCTGSYDSGTDHSHCYVVVGGEAQDVTGDLAESPEDFYCASERKEALTAVDRAREAIPSAQVKLTQAKSERAHWRDPDCIPGLGCTRAQPGSLADLGTAAFVRDAKQELSDAKAQLAQAKRALAETVG